MRIYEIISKKKRGEPLTDVEIRAVVAGFSRGEIPDYQMSALLMAIFFRGMTSAETAALTMAMVDSGERVDLTPIAHIASQADVPKPDSIPRNAGKILTADKHSTGGVGDKTTLAVVPIVAACGVTIAKMSGRGLGHTGGTIDKLEAIPGFRTALSGAEFMEIVQKLGACVAGQSANLAPADKKLYALRDVTATVDSIPLIAASIMSKKIAAGADAILLDVKTGSGAFMKSLDDARELARAMVDIGINCGRRTAALITDMSAPLGFAVGNSLELREAVLFLAGGRDSRSERFGELCLELSANMLFLAGKGSVKKCRELVKTVISGGAAFAKFKEIVAAQGGDISYVDALATDDFPRAAHIVAVKATQSGYIAETDTEKIGIAAMLLGAGRAQANDKIDHLAGIELCANRGDFVEENQTLAELYTSKPETAAVAAEKFLSAIRFSSAPPEELPLIYEAIGF